jgi:hypothetical protein
MDVTSIETPFMMGEERRGKWASAPAHLIEADAAKLVAAKGVAVNVQRVDRVGLRTRTLGVSKRSCK